MKQITKQTALFTYGENNEKTQTVGGFLELVKGETLPGLFAVNEALDLEGHERADQLTELCSTIETFITHLDSVLTED